MSTVLTVGWWRVRETSPAHRTLVSTKRVLLEVCGVEEHFGVVEGYHHGRVLESMGGAREAYDGSPGGEADGV